MGITLSNDLYIAITVYKYKKLHLDPKLDFPLSDGFLFYMEVPVEYHNTLHMYWEINPIDFEEIYFPVNSTGITMIPVISGMFSSDTESSQHTNLSVAIDFNHLYGYSGNGKIKAKITCE